MQDGSAVPIITDVQSDVRLKGALIADLLVDRTSNTEYTLRFQNTSAWPIKLLTMDVLYIFADGTRNSTSDLFIQMLPSSTQ